jgi:choline/ethanolamine kinase
MYRSLVPRDEVVFSHNDVQENNILVNLENNELSTLIDFEYGGWNPIAYDLANYLNEMCIDNAHPSGPGVKLYLNNFPT